MAFTLEKGRKYGIQQIVCHSNCPDGTVSALILSRVFPFADVVFVNYGQKEYLELPAVPKMFFCDITPPLSRSEEFEAVGAIVLDHHKKELVDPYTNGHFSDEPGVSGAVLAYRAVKELLREEEDEIFEELSTLIGIRDTWDKKNGLWNSACEVSAGIMRLPFEVWKLKNLNRVLREAQVLGMSSRLMTEKTVKEILSSPYTFTNDAGNTFLLTSGGGKISDLDEKSPFDVSISFSYLLDAKKPLIVFSLRSKEYDVRSITIPLGGGGHQKAAGFHVELEPGFDPVSFIKNHMKTLVIEKCG